jgi:hypothetical protein
MPADEQAMLTEKKLIAKDYKHFWNAAKLGQLAEELGVDGVIVISAKFGYHFFGRKTGAFDIGLAAEGKTSPEINMTAAFYDCQGNNVWKHCVHRILREGAPLEGEAADIVKLEPLMVKASELVAQSLLNSLDRRMQ